MEIINVYKESMPGVKLACRRYTNEDRDETGTFAGYWQQAFREGWFDTLKQCDPIPGVSDAYLGIMRFTKEGQNFEYWIGCFLPQEQPSRTGLKPWTFPPGDRRVLAFRK